MKIKIFLGVILLIIREISVTDGRWTSSSRPHRKHSLAYFYDTQTNRTILPPITSFDERNELRDAVPRGFGRRCDCKMSDNRMANVCSCCAGLTLPRIKFQREMCTRFQYNLSKRNQMLMDVTMNGNPIASQTFCNEIICISSPQWTNDPSPSAQIKRRTFSPSVSPCRFPSFLCDSISA